MSASGPLPPREPLPWLGRVLAVATVGALVLAAVVAGAILLDAPAVGRIDEGTLARSLDHEVGGSSGMPDLPACRASAAGRVCDIAKDSGAVTYTVRMRGRRCWSAQRQGRGSGATRTIEGCATLRQQLDLGLF